MSTTPGTTPETLDPDKLARMIELLLDSIKHYKNPELMAEIMLEVNQNIKTIEAQYVMQVISPALAMYQDILDDIYLQELTNENQPPN